MLASWKEVSENIPIDLRNYCIDHNKAIDNLLEILEKKCPSIYGSWEVR